MEAAPEQAGQALEPACWSWPVPPLETREEIAARIRAENEDLPRDARRNPAAARFVAPAAERFGRFHAGRCALCGDEVPGRVVDHCHDTGQVRGYLCVSCNVLEGRSGHPLYEAYRRRHPAAILDYYAPYHDGIGWIHGWPVLEYGATALERGRRPATLW